MVYKNRGDLPQPDAQYPLLMTPRRTNEVLNSIGRTNPKLGGKKPYNPAFLNPADLKKFGVQSGDKVRIRSRFGEVVGIHMRDDCLVDGAFDVTRYVPLARMGYRDYSAVREVFGLTRPDDS